MYREAEILGYIALIATLLMLILLVWMIIGRSADVHCKNATYIDVRVFMDSDRVHIKTNEGKRVIQSIHNCTVEYK